MLGELERVGYLVREQAHDAGGKFTGNLYILQDEAPMAEENGSAGEISAPAPLVRETRQRCTGAGTVVGKHR